MLWICCGLVVRLSISRRFVVDFVVQHIRNLSQRVEFDPDRGHGDGRHGDDRRRHGDDRPPERVRDAAEMRLVGQSGLGEVDGARKQHDADHQKENEEAGRRL